MRRHFVTLICSLLTIFMYAEEEEEGALDTLSLSTPDQIATLTYEPNYLIGGLVHPLSGQPALRQTDLIVKGAQPIVLGRSYLPPYIPCAFPKHKHDKKEWEKHHLYSHLITHYQGWLFFPHLKLRLTPSTMEVRLSDPQGMTLDFRLSGPKYEVTSLASPPLCSEQCYRRFAQRCL